MKKILSSIVAITLMISFVFPFLNENVLSKKEAFYIILFFNGFVVLFLLIYWYAPIFQSASNTESKFDQFKTRMRSSPNLLTHFAPGFSKLCHSDDFQLLNAEIAEKWFSGLAFGIAVLGFGAQYMLWLGDAADLMSGIFGRPLRFSLGRSVFSVFGTYFLLVGLSIFVIGCMGKLLSWRFK